jgi:hypothetical protein
VPALPRRTVLVAVFDGSSAPETTRHRATLAHAAPIVSYAMPNPHA